MSDHEMSGVVKPVSSEFEQQLLNFELHAGRCLFSCMRICMYDWLLGSERSRTTTWLQEYLSSMHSDDRGSEEVERGVNDVLDELSMTNYSSRDFVSLTRTLPFLSCFHACCL
eukprot:TRINITY_DN12415_c4_g3_i1.p5 TRINITY_DN12415_c4_g3~~TRINITY_DN12415_c4_g3_i1.p5  ORF type:complete len:113 (-),score=17.98 TRINITY_DN12415_c4_g3_i1:243-581(-)